MSNVLPHPDLPLRGEGILLNINSKKIPLSPRLSGEDLG